MLQRVHDLLICALLCHFSRRTSGPACTFAYRDCERVKRFDQSGMPFELFADSKMTVSWGPSYEAYSWGGQGTKFGNQTVVDKAPPEMLHLIDIRWYQYPPMNPMWFGILGFVIGTLGFISVSGNGMVVYIFLSTKSLRTPSNLFVVNLALSDFGMMFTMSPPMVGETIPDHVLIPTPSRALKE